MKIKGFTLIELLIVIAILGTLAVVVLLALNPVQQLARTRDSGRASTVGQLGHAMEAYATTHSGQYPRVSDCGGSGSWIRGCLVDTGEISTVPSLIPYSAGGSACSGGQNGFCYRVAGSYDAVVIYTHAEAKTNISKCNGSSGCPNSSVASFVYSTADGRGGFVCSGSPTPGNQPFCE